MTTSLLPLFAPLALVLAAAPSQDDGGDEAAAVARLFVERCASCHAPDSEEPKALKYWEHAHDLAATAANAELLTVGDPDDSDLFLSIEFDEMPPSDSDIAPFTDEEKALVASWIRGGAKLPPPPAPAGDDTTAQAPPSDAETATEPSPLFKWLGRLHPTVVHFPIALLLAAFLAELLSRTERWSNLRSAATFCLVLGALFAFPAAGSGWLHAESFSQRGDTLFWHRWLGVTVLAGALFTLFLGWRSPRMRLPMLGILGALVVWVGHLGGTLTYGANWLNWPGQ